MKFKDLEIGDKFGCWGDVYLNYQSPYWCICIKISDNQAEEIDGIEFYMNLFDDVQILK